MIYFDNAATGGRKPDQVLSAVASSIKTCANAGRSGHQLSIACGKLVQDCRNALNEFFDGYGNERVVFTKGCTEALNLALFGVLEKGDHILTTAMEHNSVLRPLFHLQKERGVEYDICPLDHTGNIAVEELVKRIKPHTKMVAVTTASNVTGAITPLAKIRQAIPEGVLLLCDGAQGCGHIDVKMRALGIDLLTVAGHKGMQGIQGGGALLFSERVQPKPLLFGGTGSMSLSLEQPDFYPDCLEAGTLSFPSIISLLEGTRYLTLRLAQIQSRLLMLTAYLLRGLRDMQDYTAYSIPNPCGILSLAHKTIQSECLADFLSERYGIATRGGLHCAPLMHEGLGTQDGGLLRVSFSHFNTQREIDTLLTALREIAAI